MSSNLRLLFILLGVLLLGIGMYIVVGREAPQPVQNAKPAPEITAREATISKAHAKAITVSKQFGKELKATLGAALRDGGAMQGVETCNSAAPAIAAKYSSDFISMGRTALRTRNPANAPDVWQQAVMRKFKQELATGKQPEQLSAERLTVLHDRPALQVMTPIVMGKPCLMCHGADVEPDLLAKIKQMYPDDQATGFREDELRGAFNTVVALQEPAQVKEDGS